MIWTVYDLAYFSDLSGALGRVRNIPTPPSFKYLPHPPNNVFWMFFAFSLPTKPPPPPKRKKSTLLEKPW